jgi:NADH-quinone oxidoreductase subunit M
MITAFYTTDIFIFYLAFESLTIPTFFLIYIYGSEVTKLRAGKYFLVYSFISSSFLCIAIALLYIQFGTTQITQMVTRLDLSLTTSNQISYISSERYMLIFLMLLLGFGIKIPLVPFHM